MGMITPLYRIELRGKKGKPVPAGEIGEVVIVPRPGERQVGVSCSYLPNYSWGENTLAELTGDHLYGTGG